MDPSEKHRQVFQFTEPGAPQPEPQFASPVEMHLPPGTMIDSRYEIECVIGEGGCGCVYKVRQVVLKKHFALKTLNPVGVSKLTMLRLQKEAEAASKLDHPNLVRATDFGLINGAQPFLVMDYVEGPTLAEHLSERGRIPPDAAIKIFLPICEALAYAHKEGVVHRDIKPSNIMLDTSKQLEFIPKVVDFGIAKLQFAKGNAPTLTATGEIFGTPLYMSPEQCLGSGVDHRSDIYSLGCVLYEALTGAPPFTGSNALELMMQHGSVPVPSMREASLGLQISPALEAIVAKMLEKDTRERYQNFADVAADLAAFQRGDISSKRVDALAGRKSGIDYYKIVVGLILLMTIIGVGMLSYNAGASKRPIVVAPIPLKQSEAESITVAANTIIGTQKTINRNATNQLGISGSMKNFREPELCYWDSKNQLHRVAVGDRKKIPPQAKFVYISWAMLTLKPSDWHDFDENSLAGISTNIGVDFVLPINLEQKPHLNAITSLRKLKLLSLRSADFEPDTWLQLGRMPELHWLWLYHVQINHEDITGADMTKLANLNNFKVVAIDSIAQPDPMLSALQQNENLRRLSLGDTTLDTAGAKSIARIPHLQILKLRTVSIKDPAVFDELAKAPELKALCLMEETHIPDEVTASKFVRFHNLKKFATDLDDSSEIFKAIKVVPGCRITSDTQTTGFEFLKENPAASGLW